MIRTEDNCVGCPTEMGCLGSGCPKRHEIVLVCDKCGAEGVDELYEYDDEQLCQDCLLDTVPKVDVD